MLISLGTLALGAGRDNAVRKERPKTYEWMTGGPSEGNYSLFHNYYKTNTYDSGP